VLGLNFIKHRHGTGQERYASEDGPVIFEIYASTPKTVSRRGLRIGFQVPSVDTAVTTLQEIGAAIISPPKNSPWGRRAVVDDPDGYRVELTEPLPMKITT
jgi:lactoylglutathione lyase